ncbi:sugar kinase [Coxiella endosymbiont of Ornithodoros amblus]|uniref:sugar kinase n=1 Tax=Coxiella endosymbiont of Ornithodoros amblus TaxID=1656166 RepID=UPI00244E4C26|nr:sugar kinase [Coxiella endosymbiont of Ornithodoros amblus]
MIGECLIELTSKNCKDFSVNFSGDTLNTAVYLVRSLSKTTMVTVDYVTALGVDTFSHEMLNQWLGEGIGVSLVRQITDKLPGLYLIRNDKRGERYFYYYRSQSAARALFEGEEGDCLCQKLLEFDSLYLSGITLAMLYETGRDKLLDCLKVAHEKGKPICFDTNFRVCLWPNLDSARAIIEEILELTTIGLPSFSDEKTFFGDKSPKETAQRLHRFGVQEVVVKQGENGYWLSDETGEKKVAIERVTKVIDTTGAGDAFNGAYLAARFEGLNSAAASQKAASLAATVVACRGAIIPIIHQ